MSCPECEQLRLAHENARLRYVEARKLADQYTLPTTPTSEEALKKKHLDGCANDAQIFVGIARVQIAEHRCRF
jgi:hypothetical protein